MENRCWPPGRYIHCGCSYFGLWVSVLNFVRKESNSHVPTRFIGCFTKNLSYIRAFAAFKTCELGLQIGAVVFFLVNVLTESQAKVVSECKERNNGVSDSDCENFGKDVASTHGKIALVVIETIPVLIQLCGCYSMLSMVDLVDLTI
jgi:hypothetical protein